MKKNIIKSVIPAFLSLYLLVSGSIMSIYFNNSEQPLAYINNTALSKNMYDKDTSINYYYPQSITSLNNNKVDVVNNTYEMLLKDESKNTLYPIDMSCQVSYSTASSSIGTVNRSVFSCLQTRQSYFGGEKNGFLFPRICELGNNPNPPVWSYTNNIDKDKADTCLSNFASTHISGDIMLDQIVIDIGDGEHAWSFYDIPLYLNGVLFKLNDFDLLGNSIEITSDDIYNSVINSGKSIVSKTEFKRGLKNKYTLTLNQGPEYLFYRYNKSTSPSQSDLNSFSARMGYSDTYRNSVTIVSANDSNDVEYWRYTTINSDGRWVKSTDIYYPEFGGEDNNTNTLYLALEQSEESLNLIGDGYSQVGFNVMISSVKQTLIDISTSTYPTIATSPSTQIDSVTPRSIEIDLDLGSFNKNPLFVGLRLGTSSDSPFIFGLYLDNIIDIHTYSNVSFKVLSSGYFINFTIFYDTNTNKITFKNVVISENSDGNEIVHLIGYWIKTRSRS